MARTDDSDWLDVPEAPDPYPFPLLLELRRTADGEDYTFTRTFARLWNLCACYEFPVRTWRELSGVPIGGCDGAATADEVAGLIALLIAVQVDFAAPPPRPFA